MTKKQEEQYQIYINKAKGQNLKWVAIDPDGHIFGYKYKPFWSTLKLWTWANNTEYPVLLGSNKKLAHYAPDSLRKIKYNDLIVSSDKKTEKIDYSKFIDIFDKELRKVLNAVGIGSKVETTVKNDTEKNECGVKDFLENLGNLEKQSLTHFTQDERLDQIDNFHEALVIHDSAFKGKPDDLDEYQKEFTIISGVFALRFHYMDDKKRDIGFQIFIESDGYFAPWNNESDVNSDWLSSLLYVLTKGWSLLINSEYND